MFERGNGDVIQVRGVFQWQYNAHKSLKIVDSKMFQMSSFEWLTKNSNRVNMRSEEYYNESLSSYDILRWCSRTVSLFSIQIDSLWGEKRRISVKIITSRLFVEEFREKSTQNTKLSCLIQFFFVLFILIVLETPN